jgi:hypothetical protein
LLKQARDIAAGIVGSDPSGKSVVHPYRWPGSWHRKGEPRLCAIVALNANNEINLDEALGLLTAAAPAAIPRSNGHDPGNAGGRTEAASEAG